MRVLVTGGGGFLGQYVVEKFLERGDAVRSFSRGRYPALDALGVETLQGDLRDSDAVLAACRGMDAVIHVASLAGVWGARRDFFDINVKGAAHVLGGCLKAGVGKLVYTSTPSVVWSPGEHLNADESAPYPEKHLCAYSETKALAEQTILNANGMGDLATCALRPHLIWGPRDTQLIPRLLERARTGKLIRVGKGLNLVDLTYVENVADAHVLAADRLAPESPVGGQAYFITQGQPVRLWDWIDGLLKKIGLDPVRRSISYGAAYGAGLILEGLFAGLRLRGEPSMTRFVAHQLATSHYFSIEKARRELGYRPRIGMDEGLRRLVKSLEASA